jgi:hypothetical protein
MEGLDAGCPAGNYVGSLRHKCKNSQQNRGRREPVRLDGGGDQWTALAGHNACFATAGPDPGGQDDRSAALAGILGRSWRMGLRMFGYVQEQAEYHEGN